MSAKNRSMSKSLQNEGNELFKKRQLIEAIEKYNESLEYAADVFQKAEIHADRAEAYLGMGMIVHCWFDVAMGSGFSPSKCKDLTQYDLLSQTLGENLRSNNFKSNDIAEIMRNMGNKLFAAGKYKEALWKYNESLCYADDDLNLALGYANRSAAFLELGLYPQCMKNIKKARDHGYPADKMKKLEDREMKCLEKMAKDTKITSEPELDIFKLSYEPNPKIPFIIKDLEVRTNEKFGRHVVAKRDLKPGDVISVGIPTFRSLNVPPFNFFDLYQLCGFCLGTNHLDLIPCSTCNIAMYCSDECAKKAHPSHKFEESKMLDDLITNFFYPVDFKMCDIALAICGGSYEELEKVYNESLRSPKTVFDFDFSDPNDPNYDKNQLQVILGMAGNKHESQKLHRKHLQKNYVNLSKCPPFMEKFVEHLQTVMLASATKIKRKTVTGSAEGFAFSLLTSLLNHSCDPNVQMVMEEGLGREIMIVTRPIAKGEQIFDCYSYPFAYQSKQDRIQDLRASGVDFVCDCRACKNPQKFLTAHDLPVRDPKLMKKAKPIYLSEYETTKAGLIETIKKIQKIMQKGFNEAKYPSLEWYMLVDSMMERCERLKKFD